LVLFPDVPAHIAKYIKAAAKIEAVLHLLDHLIDTRPSMKYVQLVGGSLPATAENGSNTGVSGVSTAASTLARGAVVLSHAKGKKGVVFFRL
jgi:hypothetical protein